MKNSDYTFKDICESSNQKYKEHDVFLRLKEYMNFYDKLAYQFSYCNWVDFGISPRLVNYNSYLFSSMQGTVESIHDVLIKGRINDAYALLRKFHEAVVLNVYVNLYLQNEFDGQETNKVTKIDDWLKNKQSLVDSKHMRKYIRESKSLKCLANMLGKDRYQSFNVRCNDHMHYSYFQNMMLNDNQAMFKDRLPILDNFLKDINDAFIQHFIYIFTVNEHYMMSPDYIDYLNMNLEPKVEMQYWVSPFIQEIFTKVVKKVRPDLSHEFISKCGMKLS